MATSLSGGSSISTAGLSIKEILESPQRTNTLTTPLHDLSSDALRHEELLKSVCCFRLCTSYKLYGIKCGRFNDRKHAVFCSFFSLMITSLLVSIIVPLVS